MTATLSVFVLNLDRSPERLVEMRRGLDSIGLIFDRVPAVDGRELHDADVAAAYDAAANHRHYLAPLSRSEIACFLSHRRAWGAFLETSAPGAVFLEDDVIPLGDADEIRGVMRQVADSPRPFLCKMNSLRRASRRGRAPRLRCTLLPPLTAAACGMNRAAAEQLLSFTAKFHEPVDVCLQRWWDHGVVVRIADPPLFEEKRGGGYTSTIRPPGEGPPEGRLHRELRRPIFQLRRLARATQAILQSLRG